MKTPMSKILIGCVVAGLFVCSGSNCYADTLRRVSGQGYDGVIGVQLDDAPTGQHWVPTNEQVAALERRLPEHIKSLKEQPFRNARSINDYKRQYVGIWHEGKKVIKVLFLYKGNKEVTSGEWLYRLIAVLGGGDNYLNVVYDPERGLFPYGLFSNADA